MVTKRVASIAEPLVSSYGEEAAYPCAGRTDKGMCEEIWKMSASLPMLTVGLSAFCLPMPMVSG